MVPKAKDILTWCEGHKDLRENPVGHNDGKELRQALASTPFQAGQPWCYYFALAAVTQALGGSAHVPPSVYVGGSCSEAYATAKRNKSISPYPAVGCIALFRGGTTGHYHAGIVATTPDEEGLIEVWEGNTNDTNSPEGYKVCLHKRHVKDADYIVW